MRRVVTIAGVFAITGAGCYLSHQRDESTPPDASVPPEVRVVQIAAGDDHTCAIDDALGLWCWGFAQQGQIGNGSGDPSRCEVRITEGPVVDRPVRSTTIDVFAITAGATHTCAVIEGGYACWGANCQGQLGNRTTTGSPLPAVSPGTATAIWAGAAHTCLGTEGTFACCGANERGQLGLGTTSPLSEPGSTIPVPVDGIGSIVDAALGDAHTCALESSGVVWCWGANGAGQLGDGTFEVHSIPGFVRGLPPAVTDVAAGDRHTCAATDGEAWCWGWNERGQLGNGAICEMGDEACSERPLPERVRFDGPVEQIEGGSQFTCLLSEGRVLCWGANDVGQLGDGTRASRALPAPVAGIDDAIAITCGANHACAILAGGRVSCWGRNAQGQLGIGRGDDALVPVETRFE